MRFEFIMHRRRSTDAAVRGTPSHVDGILIDAR